MRRFFCQTLDDESVSLSASESRHLCQVLRARCGDRIILLDGRGKVAHATLYSVSKRTVLCRIERCETLPAPSPTLSVFVATPRGKAMGRLVRQATELGVAQIVPILCENSVARPDAKTCATWESEGREACKQSGNPYLPQIEAPIALSDALARWPIPGFVATAPRHASGAHPASDIGDACSLWIGPEGGFSDSEQDALLGSGLTPLLIGNWVLRVETALVACAGWIRHANPLS